MGNQINENNINISSGTILYSKFYGGVIYFT
jgi:hypothetical protein